MSELEKTCGNCKYRGDNIEGYNSKLGHNVDTGYFLCKFICHQDTYEDTNKKAFTCDGSDYHSALCVSSDFGCNQWEAKDASN